MIVTKIEAAKLQLNTAICMFFSNVEPVSTHTLAGAAAGIFGDLTRNHKPDRAWEKTAQLANNLSPKDCYRIANRAQNFFKHADNSDPQEEFDFTETDTETLMIFATMNCRELEGNHSLEMSVFFEWYIACRADLLTVRSGIIVKAAQKIFPDIEKLNRPERLALGQKALSDPIYHQDFGVVKFSAIRTSGALIGTV